jgi:hypothetical protein
VAAAAEAGRSARARAPQHRGRLFAGYDAREAIGFHVFVASVLERASVPVAVHALDDKGLPVGSNAFTFSRFLVPWLCGFQGRAIFADGSDMLMQADIAELDASVRPELRRPGRAAPGPTRRATS